MGSGSGVHALEAARHADLAVGVDVSSRAVDFARFNAALNGITNARFQTGDVIRGLDSHLFDLIVSNPPYLLSPESGIVYRDGNVESGHVATRVLLEASALLAPKGLLVCLTSWGATDLGDPDRAIRRIARGSGCHVLVLTYAERTALADAIRWNSHRLEADELRRVVGSWMDFYQRQEIERILYGIVILTPMAGAEDQWFRSERVSLAGQSVDNGQLRHVVSALAQRARGKFPERLRPHPSHALDSVARIDNETTIVRKQVLRSTRGIPFTVECGPRLLDAIIAGAIPYRREAGCRVIANMMGRLYELGLLVDDTSAQGACTSARGGDSDSRRRPRAK